MIRYCYAVVCINYCWNCLCYVWGWKLLCVQLESSRWMKMLPPIPVNLKTVCAFKIGEFLVTLFIITGVFFLKKI